MFVSEGIYLLTENTTSYENRYIFQACLPVDRSCCFIRAFVIETEKSLGIKNTGNPHIKC